MVAQHVGKLERGELELKVSQLPAFAEALKIGVADLLPHDAGRGMAADSVPLVGDVCVRDVDAPAPERGADADRVPLAAPLPDADQCFAVMLVDSSADELFGPGTILVCRELPQATTRLRLGTKLVIRRYATNVATGDVLDLLFGTLDRSSQGALLVTLHSHDRSVPEVVRLRPRGRPTLTAIEGGTAFEYAAELTQLIDYQIEPHDLAEILGTVEAAWTPQ